jgi:pimeloyl-ACP methyl ester carboxylesterase
MPSLILLPGLACDAELFRDQLPAWSQRHAVKVSDAHARFDTLPAMARALLDENPGAHVWVGSSMGGMLALEIHRQAPERVLGLALLGSTARPDTPELLQLRSDAITLFEAGRMDEVLRANVMFAFHPYNVGPNARDKQLVADYLAMIHRAGAAALVRQNRAVMARIDQRPLLHQLRCPVLLACGDADGLTPLECSQEIAAAVPQAQLVVLERCGHMLSWEQPDAVTQAVLQWLAP